MPSASAGSGMARVNKRSRLASLRMFVRENRDNNEREIVTRRVLTRRAHCRRCEYRPHRFT
ncbi:Adenosylhomocysteinase [Paraburkholderia unamae]|nr:Adenosylhomocysteinase [Paraburkholderia unamae]